MIDLEAPPQPRLLSRLIKHPSHPVHLVWTFLICLTIIYFILEIIFVSCFDQSKLELQTSLKTPHLFLCTLFFLDIIINFFKVTKVNGVSHNSFKAIAVTYLKSKFVVDLVTTLTILISIVADNPYSTYLRFTILIRIWDLFRFQKVIFKLLLHHHFLRQIFTILKIFLLELFVIHCASCLFYLIGMLLMKYEYYGNPVINSEFYWLATSVVSTPIMELTIIEQYLWSFYFGAGVISTIVIGDVVGHNPIETSFILIMIFIGTISEAYLFELIVEAWGASYDRIKDYLKNLHSTTNFMRSNDIPNALQHEVQTFLEFRWLEEHYENNEEQTRILSKLPKPMKSMITMSQFSSDLNRIRLFSILPTSSTLFSKLAEEFKEVYYFKNQILINSFSHKSNLLLISKGVTDGHFQFSPSSDLLQNPYHTTNKITGIEKFITGMLGKRIIKAKTRVTALVMERSSFKDMIVDNEEVSEEFQQMNHSISYNHNYSNIHQECECCGEHSHSVMQCEQCHIPKRVNYGNDTFNERTKKSRNRLTRSRKGSNILKLTNLDDIQSIEEIRQNNKKEEIQKYIETTWFKFYNITKGDLSQDMHPLSISTGKEFMGEFEQFHIYQHYYPQYNIVSNSN